METNRITKIKTIKLFREKGISLFTTEDIRKIFEIKSENTLKQLLKRLRKEKIVKRLIRNKYLYSLNEGVVTEFQIANFLVSPSYVSLESALSFYDFIDQFPYRISSISIKKAREIKVDQKVFVYSKIKKEYFKDFILLDNFLIAEKKKALFDYLYFIYKGLRPLNILDDLKIHLKKGEVKKYILKNADLAFLKFLKKHVKL